MNSVNNIMLLNTPVRERERSINSRGTETKSIQAVRSIHCEREYREFREIHKMFRRSGLGRI